MQPELPTTYVRVDRSALKANYGQVRRVLEQRTLLCAVVKANAYGHGLVPTARLFAECSCDMLGVASPDEGVELRKGGLETPILVFHPPTREEAQAAAEHGLTVTLTDLEHARYLASAVRDRSQRVDYHVEIDVGLGRSGYQDEPGDLLQAARDLLGYPASGLWAHMGPRMVPDKLPKATPLRWAETSDVPGRLSYLGAQRTRLRAKDAPAPIFHVAASGALCDAPWLQWDIVRIGSLLYGAYPSSVRHRPFSLRPAIELRTRIVELRTVPRGALIGYGGEFRAARPTRLATLPVGLHHGVGTLPESTVSVATGVKRLLARGHGSRGRAFRAPLARLGEQHAPLVGRVSLNECTIDVTDVPDAKLGDEVTVPARMTTLNPTLPRILVDGDS